MMMIATIGASAFAIAMVSTMAAGQSHAVAAHQAAAMTPSPSAASPIGGAGVWFSISDYPPEALRAYEEGRVVIAIDVDVHGRPSACTVTESSGSASLDAATCATAMRKASFVPAKDHGKPIAGRFPTAVRWTMPVEATEIGASGPTVISNYTVDYSLNTRGEITGCTLVQTAVSGFDPCVGVQLGAKMMSPLVRNGQPVTGTARVTTSTSVTAD